MVVRTLGVTIMVVTGLLLLLPSISSAQSLDNTDPFSLTLSPQYPIPYGQSVLTPISNMVDLTNAIMTVSVNDKQIYRGNAQPLAIPLGAGGTLTLVKVAVVANGKTFSQTLSIRPQDVVVVAEPVSSAPALYAGKPLTPVDGNVRIVAVTNMKNAKGAYLDPLVLSYEWKVDSTRIASASGIGKSSIIVAAPLQYRERTVSVTVRSQDETVGGGASLSLTPQEPVVRLYENDPLLGIRFDHALSGSLSITGAEKSLYAAPYSFSTVNGTPMLRWFLNGTASQVGNSITLRPTGTGQGNASLSLVASLGDTSTATTNLSLSFGGVAKSGFFGL